MSHAARPVAALPALDGMCFKGLGGPLSGFVTPAACACGGPSVRGSRRKQMQGGSPAGTGRAWGPRTHAILLGEDSPFVPAPGEGRGFLKVHSTGQTALLAPGACTPCLCFSDAGKKRCQVAGTAEQATGGGESGGRGRPGSVLPLPVVPGRAEGTDWEGACECPRSQAFYPQPRTRPPSAPRPPPLPPWLCCALELRPIQPWSAHRLSWPIPFS